MAAVVCCVAGALELWRDGPKFWKEWLHRRWLVCALVVYCISIFLFTASLLVYHTHLILIGQTTNEKTRDRFAKYKNPFDRGVRENVSDACRAAPDSYVCREGYVVGPVIPDQHLLFNYRGFYDRDLAKPV
eukprot:c19955_g1_i6.p2 GENE.c19955_g1_i6~~c19955_g1_i6.p2  ORF type:complete len:131 (-),score=26.76 c19955_g1_i6:66-458(-)